MLDYEVTSLLNKIKSLADNLFNPLIDHLTEELISLKDLANIIRDENVELAMIGKRISVNASECFNG